MACMRGGQSKRGKSRSGARSSKMGPRDPALHPQSQRDPALTHQSARDPSLRHPNCFRICSNKCLYPASRRLTSPPLSPGLTNLERIIRVSCLLLLSAFIVAFIDCLSVSRDQPHKLGSVGGPAFPEVGSEDTRGPPFVCLSVCTNVYWL